MTKKTDKQKKRPTIQKLNKKPTPHYKKAPKDANNAMSTTLARTPSQARMIRETVNALILTDTQKDAGQLLGINHSSLYRRIRNYPEINKGVEAELAQVKADAMKRIRSGVPTYVKNIQELANEAKSEGTKLTANLELLDRGGLQKPNTGTNVQVNVLNAMNKQAKDYEL